MKQKKARVIPVTKNTNTCYTHRPLAEWLKQLNRLPDAAEIERDKRRSAPRGLVEMVF